MHAHTGVLRERVLRAAHACFGHRLMMDVVAPGGTNADLTSSGLALVRELMANIRDAFPALVELYDNTTSLQDRTVGTGVLRPELARQYGCGGFVGRASGRSFDARRDFAYAPYDQLEFETPVLVGAGDVNARVWIRIREIQQSLRLLDQILDRMPSGEIRDPSWFQWPLLEAAIEGNIVADFPICNKSFNCSYSGHDL